MAKAKIQEAMEKPLWLKYSEEEVRSIILKLEDKGMTSEKIGLILRDQYGIPKVKLFNLKIKEVMKDKFAEPSVINLQNKVKKLEEHNKKNRQDKKSDRALILTKSKLKKRTDYHSK
ncbi:hypothetical protein J4456_02615 [Candidatus Pacearchaeota archaeon]|nr:hypothetical protein [uncultured archaeon]MBS3093451.1 hypothetical protein [Candidatus Pacearchaeota archaeon]